jgi:hypothetical protein
MGVNTKTGKSSGPVKGQVPAWAEPYVRVADWIYPWCLWVGGIALFALLTTLLFGKTDGSWISPALGAFAFFTNIGFAGWVGILIGAALLFGGRVAVTFLAAQGNVDGQDPFLNQLYDYVPNVGMVVLAISIVRLMVGFALVFIYEQTRSGSKKYKYATSSANEKPGAFPKCWQMSRCRPGVRESCPNFTDRLTCWRRRSGCFCDRNLANYLVSVSDRKDVGEIDGVARAAINMDRSAGKGAIRGYMMGAAKRPWLQQRRLCHECPLFLEHQEYKYRYWHWISFPITGGVVAVMYHLGFHEAYNWIADKLDMFMEKLVEMGKLPSNFDPSASNLKDSPFEYVLLFMVSLIIASYIVALIDKMFLDWKM